MNKKVLTDKSVKNLKPAAPGKRRIVEDAVGARVGCPGHRQRTPVLCTGGALPRSPHFVRREMVRSARWLGRRPRQGACLAGRDQGGEGPTRRNRGGGGRHVRSGG